MTDRERLISTGNKRKRISTANKRNLLDLSDHHNVSEAQRTTQQQAQYNTGGSESKLRIVLVGKTGAGKSSAGNTILGKEIFKTAVSPESFTGSCEKKEAKIDGKNISVIDTPGLFDTRLTKMKMKAEVVECVEKSAPGPHVFLLVIRLDVKFTAEEKNTVKWIQENFGEEAARYTIILFTHADALDGKPLDDYISESQDLQALVSQCFDRYHPFNNKDKNNRSQVTELMEMTEKMVEENGGQHYTNKMYKEAQMRIVNREQFWSKEPRIVLLGKAGSGKSSAVQTIVGRNSSERTNPATETCETHKVKVNKKMIKIIDTPGLIGAPEKFVKAKKKKCIELSAPGPHVFLLVIRLDVKLTEEEKHAVKWIQKNFKEEAVQYTIILFTHADLLKGGPVDQYIKENNDLQAFINEFGGRFHSFNNEDMSNCSQVTELMKKIEKMMEENGWWCHTNELFQGYIKKKLIEIATKHAKNIVISAGSTATAAVATGIGLLVVTEIAVAGPVVLIAGGIVGLGVAGAAAVFAIKKSFFQK